MALFCHAAQAVFPKIKIKGIKMDINNLNIVYEDNHIIVVVKPQNVLSQSDETGDGDMLSMIKEYIKQTYNKPGNVFVGLVHRLDRPTGGLMVFAKTSKAAKRLSEALREKTFKKKYFAVVENPVKQSHRRLEDYLIKDEKTNLVRLCPQTETGARLAILDYSLVQTVEELSLLKVQIHTGRSHQIRVQLSNIKNPLYGDFKYGAKRSEKTSNLALWAYKLEFMHPVNKTVMKFTSLPPQEEKPWNLFNLERNI